MSLLSNINLAFKLRYTCVNGFLPIKDFKLELFDANNNLIYVNEFQARPMYCTSWFATLPLKEGQYTSVLTGPCGQVRKQHTLKYPYRWSNLGYRQSYDCEGYKLHVLGDLFWEDKPDGNASYRIIAGSQSGYPTDKRRLDQPALVKTGRYSVEIINSQNWAIDTIVPNITPQLLQLDETQTLAYACADNQNEQGYMFVKAKNGIAPYKYELWSADNTQKMPVEAIIDSKGLAQFAYGKVGDTYTIRISDACGNNFAQHITINDLSRFSIASTPDNFVCHGDEVRLYCAPMERYEWTGPNGFTSTEQNPRIRNANRSMAGRYTVLGYPRACGKGVTGI